MSLLDRISARTVDRPAEQRYSADQWINEYLIPSSFQFGGSTYPIGLNTTWGNRRIEEVSNTLPGYAAALRQSPPAFAAEMVRALVLSQVRFTYRNLPSTATPRRTFGNRDLQILERPWPNATTGELVARMEWHAGLAGNAFVIRQQTRLRVLRPDWVIIVYGSDQEPDDAAHALDGQIIGYVYCNGGIGVGRPQMILPEDMAHWSPLPDPEAAGLGQSWITPAVREIQGDIAATQHKLTFFSNGATPNLVVKGITAANSTQFNEIVEALESKHTGLGNAYRTLYLTAGADASVVGSDLKQIDFKATQGAGETRISILSRVPASLLGISEGLAGSSLNAGNFSAARRGFGDTWVIPTLQDLASCLSVLVKVPSDAELWFDTADMTLLREDAKDAAEIEQLKAATIVSLVSGGGFTHESAIAAVQGQNMSLLKPIPGWISVQLQQAAGPAGVPADAAQATDPALAARSRHDDGELDEEEEALFVALEELGEESRAFNPSKHARNPKGSPGGGRFRSMVDRIKDALDAHAAGDGKGDPFKDFSREQLRRVAKAKGVALPRGASREHIAEQLLKESKGGKPASPAKAVAAASPPVNKKTGAAVRPLKKAPGRFGKLSPAKADAMQAGMTDGKPWTARQQAAVAKYTGPAYKDINNALRTGGGGSAAKADAAEIHGAMRDIPQNITVSRTVRPDAFGYDNRAWIPEGDVDSFVGRTFHDPGFTSTSVGERTNGFVQLRISVPAGTRGAYVESVSQNQTEYEMLLDRGTHFKIIRAERNGNDTIFHVMVVGQDE